MFFYTCEINTNITDSRIEKNFLGDNSIVQIIKPIKTILTHNKQEYSFFSLVVASGQEITTDIYFNYEDCMFEVRFKPENDLTCDLINEIDTESNLENILEEYYNIVYRDIFKLNSSAFQCFYKLNQESVFYFIPIFKTIHNLTLKLDTLMSMVKSDVIYPTHNLTLQQLEPSKLRIEPESLTEKLKTKLYGSIAYDKNTAEIIRIDSIVNTSDYKEMSLLEIMVTSFNSFEVLFDPKNYDKNTFIVTNFPAMFSSDYSNRMEDIPSKYTPTVHKADDLFISKFKEDFMFNSFIPLLISSLLKHTINYFQLFEDVSNVHFKSKSILQTCLTTPSHDPTHNRIKAPKFDDTFRRLCLNTPFDCYSNQHNKNELFWLKSQGKRHSYLEEKKFWKETQCSVHINKSMDYFSYIGKGVYFYIVTSMIHTINHLYSHTEESNVISSFITKEFINEMLKRISTVISHNQVTLFPKVLKSGPIWNHLLLSNLKSVTEKVSINAFYSYIGGVFVDNPDNMEYLKDFIIKMIVDGDSDLEEYILKSRPDSLEKFHFSYYIKPGENKEQNIKRLKEVFDNFLDSTNESIVKINEIIGNDEHNPFELPEILIFKCLMDKRIIASILTRGEFDFEDVFNIFTNVKLKILGNSIFELTKKVFLTKFWFNEDTFFDLEEDYRCLNIFYEFIKSLALVEPIKKVYTDMYLNSNESLYKEEEFVKYANGFGKSLFGAVLTSKGFVFCYSFISNVIRTNWLRKHKIVFNHKSELYNTTRYLVNSGTEGVEMPRFATDTWVGEDDFEFISTVFIGREEYGSGFGKTKNEAEKTASREALSLLKENYNLYTKDELRDYNNIQSFKLDSNEMVFSENVNIHPIDEKLNLKRAKTVPRYDLTGLNDGRTSPKE